MIRIKNPTSRNIKEIKHFFEKKNLNSLIKLIRIKTKSVNNMNINDSYPPELVDLYNLYQYVLINKRTTILEFGSGWSTLIFSLALKELRDKYLDKIKSLRRNNPFELFVLENEKKYLMKITI